MMTFSPFLLHALKSENWISLFSAGIPACRLLFSQGSRSPDFPLKGKKGPTVPTPLAVSLRCAEPDWPFLVPAFCNWDSAIPWDSSEPSWHLFLEIIQPFSS